MGILTIAETKLGGSFRTAQFQIKGYYSPFRLDITNKNGGLLVYTSKGIACIKLQISSYESFLEGIEDFFNSF